VAGRVLAGCEQATGGGGDPAGEFGGGDHAGREAGDVREVEGGGGQAGRPAQFDGDGARAVADS
jgi:hypothetical protein